MPLTSAERCRKYREKLKQENPAKFEEMKKKNAERTKAKKIKIADMTENEKQEVRKRWREEKRKLQKEAEPVVVESQRARRRYRSQVGRENLKLKQKNEILHRKNDNLRKMLTRYRKKINALTNEIVELKSERELKASEIQSENVNTDEETSKTVQYENELTPMTKSNNFIEEELPNISEEAKERVKQKLLQQHVLEVSLKETYKVTKPFKERSVLKKLVENESVKKYNMKSRLTKCLGLKSGIRCFPYNKQKRIKTAKQMKKFYERDDVSRMTAGKKEYVTHKKIQKQKRFLLDTLPKLYKKYRNEGGNVSFTTFKRYRPFYVVSPKINNRNTCVCMKHANLAFKAYALKKIGLIETTDLNELVSEIVCDVKSKSCMYSECDLCSDKKLDLDIVADCQEVTWFEWSSKTHEFDKCGEKKITKKVVKENKTGALNTLTELLQSELQKFKVHHFNIYHQYKQYKDAIEEVQDNEVILHCDFSENYMCKMAEEVQAMHFGASKRQVTLHTGVLYAKNMKPFCFCTVSPSLKHGPEAIWGHLKPVIDFVKEKFPKIDRIHIWSDGPTTQYRNKKNFILFCEKTKKEGFYQATWSFFEASHGKGAADGVGGVIKRTLDARVAYGEDVVDAKSAFEILSNTVTSVKTFYVSEANIDAITIRDPENILPIPSTMKLHQVIATDDKNKIKYRNLSCFCTRGNCDCFSTKTHVLMKTEKKGKEVNDTKELQNIDLSNIKEFETENKRNIKESKEVTILEDIKNTPENRKYFDLKSYFGKTSLTAIDLDFRIAPVLTKEKEHNLTINTLQQKVNFQSGFTNDLRMVTSIQPIVEITEPPSTPSHKQHEKEDLKQKQQKRKLKENNADENKNTSNIKRKRKKVIRDNSTSEDSDLEVKYTESGDSYDVQDDYLSEDEYKINKSSNKNIQLKHRGKLELSKCQKTKAPKHVSDSDTDCTDTENVPLSNLASSNTKVLPQNPKYTSGCYVIVKYEDKHFPGRVECVLGNHYEVSTMVVSAGNSFKWPDKPDKIWYGDDEVIEKIAEPVCLNKRGFYRIKEMEKYLPDLYLI